MKTYIRISFHGGSRVRFTTVINCAISLAWWNGTGCSISGIVSVDIIHELHVSVQIDNTLVCPIPLILVIAIAVIVIVIVRLRNYSRWWNLMKILYIGFFNPRFDIISIIKMYTIPRLCSFLHRRTSTWSICCWRYLDFS